MSPCLPASRPIFPFTSPDQILLQLPNRLPCASPPWHPNISSFAPILSCSPAPTACRRDPSVVIALARLRAPLGLVGWALLQVCRASMGPSGKCLLESDKEHSSQPACLQRSDWRRNSPSCLGSAQMTNWEVVPIVREGGPHCLAAQNPWVPGARALQQRAGKKRNPIVFWI